MAYQSNRPGKEGKVKKKVKLKGLPKDAYSIIHFHPHAYCVAKPAIHCAVFVIPPQENRLIGRMYEGSESVHNASVKDVSVGDWCSLAFCDFGKAGVWHTSGPVAVPYQPDFKIGKRKAVPVK